MFPMTVTISNVAQLNAVMALLAGGMAESPSPAPVVIENTPAPKKEAAPAKKSEAAPTPAATATTQPTATAVADAAPEKKVDAQDSPKSIDYKTVADAVVAVSTKLGRPAALAVLGKHNLATLKDAKPEQYAAILADALAALPKAS